MLGAPLCGSRTWMWTIEAPAPAASIAASAICAGVIGRPGCWSGLVMLPVTAQLMMTLSTGLSLRPARLLEAEGYAKPPVAASRARPATLPCRR